MLQHADFLSLRTCHFTACLFHSITSYCNSILIPFIWLLSVQFPECLQSVMRSKAVGQPVWKAWPLSKANGADTGGENDTVQSSDASYHFRK